MRGQVLAPQKLLLSKGERLSGYSLHSLRVEVSSGTGYDLKMENINTTQITDAIQTSFPKVQGIYLFGSFSKNDARLHSDVDIAILLPHTLAKQVGYLSLSPLHLALEKDLKRRVDLINLRQVSTVLQKEVIATGRLLAIQDQYAVDEFEMLTLSFYQKLNEERKELLDDFWKTGKAYNV